jgi:hypothetical protein
MFLFRVCIYGNDIGIHADGVQKQVGFFKNYYVLALTRELAKYKALSLAEADVKTKGYEGVFLFKKIDIGVDSAECSMNYFRLITKNGYIFYEME